MIINTRLVMAMASSLALTILPLPEMATGFRPQWVLLLVLYIQFFLPNYFRVTWLLLLGLCLDVLLMSVMGEHAFALLLTSWFAAGKTRRFVFFSTIQQMVLMIVFCFFYQLIIYLIDASLGFINNRELWFVCETVLSSVFVWPWMKWLSDELVLSRLQIT